MTSRFYYYLFIDKKLPARRKILVFVNPFSGSGKSLKIFNSNVAPMFTDAAIDYTLFITGNFNIISVIYEP